MKIAKITVVLFCIFLTLFYYLKFDSAKKKLRTFYLKNAISEKHGLQGFYNLDSAKSQRIDQKLLFHSKNSKIFAKEKNFSIIWRGLLKIEKSRFYKLGTISDDGSLLYIDGLLLVDNSGEHPLIKKDEKIFLSEGCHTIDLFYTQNLGEAYLELFWSWYKVPRACISAFNLIPLKISTKESAIDSFQQKVVRSRLFLYLSLALNILALLYLILSSKLQNYSLEISLAIISFILLFIFAPHLPGLSIDECWNFFFVKKIANGLRPLNGMNNYTGALYHYLLWGFFIIFGYSAEVLRLVPAVLNALTVYLALLLMRNLFSTAKANRLWLGILFCSFPVFASFSRLSIEPTALNPVLTFAGLLFIVKALKSESGKKEIFMSLLGGFFLGICAYSHIIEVTSALALGLSCVLVWRLSCFFKKTLWFSTLGFILGLSPRFYSLLYLSQSSASRHKLSSIKSLGWLSEFKYLPKIVSDLVNGTVIYQRFTGDISFQVIPYISIALLCLLLGALLLGKRKKPDKSFTALLLFAVFSIILRLIISPSLSLRYFLIPLLSVPFILILFSSLWLKHQNFIIRLLGNGILASILVLNCLYLSLNYYIPFLKTGGKPGFFKLGNRLIETSNHFIRTDRLYKQLSEKKIEKVFAENFIIWPLSFYDFNQNRLKLIAIDPHELPRLQNGKLAPKIAVAFYNAPLRKGFTELLPARKRTDLPAGRLIYRFDSSFDKNFTVFILEPK